MIDNEANDKYEMVNVIYNARYMYFYYENIVK